MIPTFPLPPIQTQKVISLCEERSDEAISNKNEIAAPFGLAMTCKII